MTYLINTFLGFFIAQLYDILKRNKASERTPKKFDIKFFFRDTWQKIVFSLMLSISISFAIKTNIEELSAIFGFLSNSKLIYFGVGFAPELILQFFKKKYNFLQPENTK